MRQNKNTGGFSLVEIMVAIAILAIITVPMMGYFVDSTKQNARAKEVQEAMTAGQTVMEEAKTLTVRELWDSADYTNLRPDGITVAPPGPFVEQSVVSGSPYYFKKEQASGGKSYDVYLSLDPRGTGNKYAGVNQTEMAYLPEAAGTDVVTILQDVQDSVATNMYLRLHRNARALLDFSNPVDRAIPERTADFIKNNIKKDIFVDMEYPDALLKDTIEIDVTYKYTPLNLDIYGVDVTDVIDLGTETYTVNTPTGAALSVYFFYDALPGAEKESITFSSSLGLPAGQAVQFYLICQEDPSSGKLPQEIRPAYHMGQNVTAAAVDLIVRSNVPSAPGVAGTPVIEKKKPQRLFEFKLQVFRSGDRSHVLAEYDSAKGVWKDE